MRRIIITLTVLAAFLVSAVPANALIGSSPLEPGGTAVVDPKFDPVAAVDPRVDPVLVTILKAGYSAVDPRVDPRVEP